MEWFQDPHDEVMHSLKLASLTTCKICLGVYFLQGILNTKHIKMYSKRPQKGVEIVISCY